MSNKQPVMAGPWRGMDLRENGDASNTYFVGINVDTSNGLIEARPTFTPGADSTPYRARLHVIDRPDQPRIILSVGMSTTLNGDIVFRAHNADSLAALGAQQNLSTDFGEIPDVGSFNCSFVDATLNPTNGTPRPVVLVVTPCNTYVYEPSISLTTLRAISVANDSFQINGVNYAYWESTPRGPIAVTHQSRVYYAGFRDGQSVVFDNPLADKQNDVPETNLGPGRDTLILNPSMVVWSDEYDPAGIRGDHFIQIDNGERVTGLHSLGEALLIFGDKNIYLLGGYSDDTYTLTRVHGGVGCAGPHTIVQVGNETYFLTSDGVWVFGGLAAPQVLKLSEGLNPLFLGWKGTQTQLPDCLREYLGAYGWPWQIITSDLHLSNAVYLAKYNQIWWSLPSTGVWKPKAFPLTLVYDVENRGFNLYMQSPSGVTNGLWNTCMYDAVTLDNGTRLVSSSNLGQLQEFGAGSLYDGVVDGTWSRGVPMFWLSSRIMGENDQFVQAQAMWIKMLSTGNVVTDQPGVGPGGPTTVGSDSVPYDIPMYFIEGEESVCDQMNDLGVDMGYDNRKTITGALPCHPNSGGTYFYGTGKYGTAKAAPVGWFTSRASVQLSSRSLRIGVVDDPKNRKTRGNNVHIAAIRIETSPPLGTRR